MEDFGYKKNNESKPTPFATKKIFLFSATLFSLSAFFYISLKAYHFINQDAKEIETIKGPKEPIKVFEESDYNDKNSERVVNRSIYDDIFGNRKEIIREDIKINKNSEPAFPPREYKKESAEDLKNDNAENAEKVPNPEQKNNENLDNKNSAEASKNAEINPKKPQELAKPQIESEPKPKAPIAKKRSSIRVQISAMSSRESCEEYYKKLSRLYPTIFSRTKYYVEQADLGKRGMFYRLQIGDFYNQVDAEEFCAGFISQTQKSRSECIIVE